jgi:hypothetical protein
MGSPGTLDSGSRSHSRTDDHIRARPGIALVLAGGLELELGLWPARWWAASAPTGLHHHTMSHASKSHREVGNRTSRFALRTGHFSPSREIAS